MSGVKRLASQSGQDMAKYDGSQGAPKGGVKPPPKGTSSSYGKGKKK